MTRNMLFFLTRSTADQLLYEIAKNGPGKRKQHKLLKVSWKNNFGKLREMFTSVGNSIYINKDLDSSQLISSSLENSKHNKSIGTLLLYNK